MYMHGGRGAEQDGDAATVVPGEWRGTVHCARPLRRFGSDREVVCACLPCDTGDVLDLGEGGEWCPAFGCPAELLEAAQHDPELRLWLEQQAEARAQALREEAEGEGADAPMFYDGCKLVDEPGDFTEERRETPGPPGYEDEESFEPVKGYAGQGWKHRGGVEGEEDEGYPVEHPQE
jgi:hypothetical protein